MLWSEFSCFMVFKCLCRWKYTAARLSVTKKDFLCNRHAGKLVNIRQEKSHSLCPGCWAAFVQAARITFQYKLKLWMLGLI